MASPRSLRDRPKPAIHGRQKHAAFVRNRSLRDPLCELSTSLPKNFHSPVPIPHIPLVRTLRYQRGPACQPPTGRRSAAARIAGLQATTTTSSNRTAAHARPLGLAGEMLVVLTFQYLQLPRRIPSFQWWKVSDLSESSNPSRRVSDSLIDHSLGSHRSRAIKRCIRRSICLGIRFRTAYV